jgi:type II secretory pathway pseudopilin PulG
VAQQQIATWFQNRRARQRKKQLQQDFELLKKCLRAAFLENQALRCEVSPAAGGGPATTAGGPSLGSRQVAQSSTLG